MHTGRGILGGGDYVGIDVNRAARIANAAHGGQVALSAATHALVEHRLPDGVSMRDLGENRFKGIRHPEKVYDLVVEGLATEFPPLPSLDTRRSNLPIRLTSFVGRKTELEELIRLMGEARILTLTGPGGIGKTRLAVELADRCLQDFGDGTVFVDLSAVTDPDVVASEILGALASTPADGRPIVEKLKEHLVDKELLLVIDNFEQVVDAAPMVEELVSTAAEVKAVVTSRVSLSLRGEQEFPVPPLSSVGVDLFADRARAINPAFEVTEENAAAVAGVVARLDGLPLAIELAATRVRLLTPEEMLRRLENRLGLLTTGQRTLPARHRTLRAVIEWSYDLLDDAEQTLLCGLAVFSGGWTLGAAEAVCDFAELGLDPLDGLSSLVDKSLVIRAESDGDQPRFSMLETIREFALERLDASPEAELVRRWHVSYYHALVLEAEPHLNGRDLIVWLQRCGREHDNIRAALRWALDAGDAELAEETAGAFWRFWQHRGHYAEAADWFDKALAMPSGQGRTQARAKALGGAGGIAWWRFGPEAGVFYEEALDLEREHGDPKRIAEALYNWGYVAMAKGDFEGASAAFDESVELFRSEGDELRVALIQSERATQQAMQGNWDAAVSIVEETVVTLRELGSPFHLGNALSVLSVGYFHTGRRAEAGSAAVEFLDLAVRTDDPAGVAATVLFISFLSSWQGRDEESLQLAGAAAALRDKSGGGPSPDVFQFLVGNPVEDARARLPEEVAERAWEAGEEMSQEEAVVLAREEAAKV